MKHPTNLYKLHRVPVEIIQYAVWLCHRFNMRHRDVEDLLAEKGIFVNYEAIRLWCNKSVPCDYWRSAKSPGMDYNG